MSNIISNTLKAYVMLCGPNLEFEAKNVSAHSLRATCDMVLLCAGVDSNIIEIIGRWIINEMLC